MRVPHIDAISRSLARFTERLIKPVTRLTFVKVCMTVIAAAATSMLPGRAFALKLEAGPRKSRGTKGLHDLVEVTGPDPSLNVKRAVNAMGGMGRFVKKGDIVLVKPNMAWDRTPEQAGNTDPDVVGALVELCYEAGAKKVKVFDGPCNEEKRVYAASGIADAAKLKGADVFFANSWNVAKAHFPYESPMEGWPIYRDAIECDVFINVPILKHHRLTRLTISMKNLMGVCSGDRGRIHADIGEKLADLAFFIKPDLTVIDATRVLFRNGPSGGDLADVERRDTIIVATDLVLADTFAAGFVDVNPLQVPNIKPGSDKGLGSMDLAGADIVRLGSA